MKCSIIELQEKSVIDSATGAKIGSVCDVEIDTETATLSAIIVLVRHKGSSVISKGEKARIEWKDIKVIGSDAILVDCEGQLNYLVPDKSFIEKLWN